MRRPDLIGYIADIMLIRRAVEGAPSFSMIRAR
jgi:hypothetical protein